MGRSCARGRRYFPKFDFLSEVCFTSKMCLFSVRNNKICSEQSYVFVKVSDMIGIYEKIQIIVFGF